MIDELRNLGIKITGNKTQFKTTCPKCSHTRKNKLEKCLSVNTTDGKYCCHNCGWSGYAKTTKQQYTIPPKISVELSPKIIDWFKERAISLATLSNWKISESVEYMPQVQENQKCINFNYFKNEKLVNIKYRSADKNFKMVKNAELVFYGIDNLKNHVGRCYIVEGEMDALSLHEAGIYSVISVPNGASKGNQNLQYLDNCYEFFKEINEVILCTDNDEAGIKLRNELARRLGYYRCKFVDWGEYKDANNVLIEKGSETLRTYLKKAKQYPLEGVLNIDDIWDSVLNYSEQGIENFSIGLGESDTYFKMAFGEWSVVSGIPNSGKSDLIDQILVNMAVKYGFRSAIFSPESFPYEGHIKRMANKFKNKMCSTDDLDDSKEFIKEYFSWIKIDLKNLTLNGILQAFKELVLQRGVKICVIDPYNMLDHSAQKDFSYIGKQLSQITQFCQQTNTHLFLIAHPRKITSENGVFAKPNLYSISGSADFFNKAYNGIIVYRCIGNRTKYKSDLVKVHVEKVKRKENGQLGTFEVAPDFKNGGVYRALDKSDKIITIEKDIPF
jgi:twinkle protein